MKTIGLKIKQWLQSLSFRTGVIVLMCCIPFYILSFAQMLLPISATAKGVLWAVLFGLAKTCQYGGLTILGVEGYKRLRDMIGKYRKKRYYHGNVSGSLSTFERRFWFKALMACMSSSESENVMISRFSAK